MLSATMTRSRVETPARWQAALWRAIDHGVRCYQVAGTGQWFATSASKPGVAFAVTADECECEAAVFGNDPVCQHRAALRCELGLLWPESPEPTPTPPVAPVVPLWSRMLANADGRTGSDARESRRLRRERAIARTA